MTKTYDGHAEGNLMLKATEQNVYHPFTALGVHLVFFQWKNATLLGSYGQLQTFRPHSHQGHNPPHIIKLLSSCMAATNS